jgi:predicted homoserine dehydrogenase-like protein
VIVEATGNPAVGIRHALMAFEAGVHVAMVNVEADALAGPLLAREAASAGVVYSLAYGDQPALIVELVDWARTAGFEVIAAGKGTRYQPHLHQSTPATVWDHYGIDALHAQQNHLNGQMFNSFLDGTKSGIEMAAVANACGLAAPADGLMFPDLAISELPDGLKPKADGGLLDGRGMVEVIASERRDGTEIEQNLRWGVYVTFAGDTDYARTCFNEYGIITDATGNYSAMWRPAHLIGLELGLTVASAALRKEPTGVADAWRGDVVAVAKFDLSVGDMLDGEGGYTVWGKLMPAKDSVAIGGLPIGLAHGLKLKRPIPQGQPVRWNDVDIKADDFATQYRKRMENEFAPT